MPRKYNINAKTLTAPLAAFTMATILFVYARTSIQAAKRNAQRHREADGGQISWRNESLRRHGVLAPPEEQGVIAQLVRQGGEKDGSGRDGLGGKDGRRGRVELETAETVEERIVREKAAARRGA